MSADPEQLPDNHPAFAPKVKYPWDTWLDGTKWRIRQDMHFPRMKVGSMSRHIRETAKDRGKRVRIVKEHLPTAPDGSLITTPVKGTDYSSYPHVYCLCLQQIGNLDDGPEDNTNIMDNDVARSVPDMGLEQQLPSESRVDRPPNEVVHRPYVKRT